MLRALIGEAKNFYLIHASTRTLHKAHNVDDERKKGGRGWKGMKKENERKQAQKKKKESRRREKETHLRFSTPQTPSTTTPLFSTAATLNAVVS